MLKVSAREDEGRDFDTDWDFITKVGRRSVGKVHHDGKIFDLYAKGGIEIDVWPRTYISRACRMGGTVAVFDVEEAAATPAGPSATVPRSARVLTASGRLPR